MVATSPSTFAHSCEEAYFLSSDTAAASMQTHGVMWLLHSPGPKRTEHHSAHSEGKVNNLDPYLSPRVDARHDSQVEPLAMQCSIRESTRLLIVRSTAASRVPVANERQMLSRQACSAGLIPTRRPVVHANWLASLRSAIVTQICQTVRSFSTADEDVTRASRA